MSTVVALFPNTNLRSGHDGLTKIARRHKKNPSALGNGEFLCFLNTAQTAMKLLSPGNILTHYKHPRGKIYFSAIKNIPLAFNGGEFDFDRALEKTFKDEMGDRYEQ